MITIVNYGVGNISAVVSATRQTGQEVLVASSVNQLEGAKKLILPGVGSLNGAMQSLNKSGMRDLLEKLVIDKKVPVLGICVGMQMFARNSSEGNAKGLGWIDAEVLKLECNRDEERIVLPHMGFNNVEETTKNCALLADMPDNPLFYFLHSYFVKCNKPNNVLAKTFYSTSFSSVINQENIYGVQFHPEKSHTNGIMLFRNFTQI